METKIGQTKSRKFSGIKLLKKAVKSEQKSKWTYVVDIRPYKYVIKKAYVTNGTTVKQNKRNRVKCAFTGEIRTFYYYRRNYSNEARIN